MKHVQPFSRQRIVLTCGLLATLGVLALVPWRVVAQTPVPKDPAAPREQNQPAANAAKSPPAAPEQPAERKAAADTSVEQNTREKLIGSWRAGTSPGKLTFNADGTFSQFPNTLSESFAYLAGLEISEKPKTFEGSWKLVDGALEFTWKGKLRRFKDSRDAQPVPDAVLMDVQTKALISRLDPTFLRFTIKNIPSGEDNTLFFRRIEIVSLDTLKGQLPEEVLRVAELAGMDSQEALALDKWIKSETAVADKLKLIERTAAAKNGKLTFAELLNLNPVEDQAYADLKKLTSASVVWALQLAEQGLLEDNEQRSAKKVKAFAEGFNTIAYAANAPNRPKYAGGVPGFGGGGGGGFGGGGIPGGPAAEKTPTEKDAALKLQSLIDELGNWLFLDEKSPLRGGEHVQPLSDGTNRRGKRGVRGGS